MQPLRFFLAANLQIDISVSISQKLNFNIYSKIVFPAHFNNSHNKTDVQTRVQTSSDLFNEDTPQPSRNEIFDTREVIARTINCE